MNLHIKSAAGCLVLLVLTATQGHSQETRAGTDIDAATIAAYEKLGAFYGAMGTDRDPIFREGAEHAKKGVPGFRFRTFPAAKLPQVAVSFGLDLTGSNVTDAGLKELAGLHKLTSLGLAVTQVTDAGLRELAGLSNLATLDLSETKVTDAGMKVLTGRLDNLASLDLSSTLVTDEGFKDLAGFKKLATLTLAGTN